MKSVLLRFPERSTPIGGKINEYLQKTGPSDLDAATLHQLFSDNRREFADAIKSDLASGKTVIADRYSFSGVAYSTAKGLDFEECKKADSGTKFYLLTMYHRITCPGFNLLFGHST